MERSELSAREVVSLPLLLTVFGSLVAEVTVAVLLMEPVASDARSTVRSMPAASSPLGRLVASLQVTTCRSAEQVHPVPVAEAKVSEVGRVSLTTIGSAASEGPRLPTAIRYEPLSPAVKVPWWVLVTQRSAEVTIEVGSLLLLLEPTGSLVADRTDAVLVTVVAAWDGGVLTTTQRVEAVSPAGRLASAVQLTWLADDPLQSQALPPLADTTLKGDGT